VCIFYQVGQSTRPAVTSSSVYVAPVEIQDISVFSVHAPRTMAEICGSYFGNKFKKKKRKNSPEDDKDVIQSENAPVKPAKPEPMKAL
jgi:hypothetical protein